MDRHRCLEPATGLGRSRDMSPTGDEPHGQISPPEDAASASSESTTEREWSAMACRRLFLAAPLLPPISAQLSKPRGYDARAGPAHPSHHNLPFSSTATPLNS